MLISTLTHGAKIAFSASFSIVLVVLFAPAVVFASVTNLLDDLSVGLSDAFPTH